MKSNMRTHNFPSMSMLVDTWNPLPFLAKGNDHFGFKVVMNQ